MKAELIKAEDYGLVPAAANKLTAGLKTIQSERDLLVKEFEVVSKLEITQGHTVQFKELRLKIVKNRTLGINKWHKTNKEYFLTGGKFVDAIKNREAAINEEMEQKLMDAEKFFETQEKERLVQLQITRVEAISLYIQDANMIDFSIMDQDIFDTYLAAKITAAKEAVELEEREAQERIAAEKKAEKERLAQEEKDRLEKKRLAVENAKLKKEQAAKDQLRTDRSKEMQPYAVFIGDYECLISMTPPNYKKELAKIVKGAKQQWGFDRQEEAKAAAEETKRKVIYDAGVKAQKAAADALIAKTEADLKKRKDAAKLAKAPVKKQLNIWVSAFAIEDFKVDDPTADVIIKKFADFKVWANKQIDKA